MDSTRPTQDQRKRGSARISSALKRAASIVDQLCFPRECAHCSCLLKEPKQRLCAACLDLLDPRSATFGCKSCLKPLRELGEERTLEQCACKQTPIYQDVLFLEPADGVLQSLIKSKALLEEREISRALGAYLVQIALESNQSLPTRILCYSSSKEEKLIQRALEKMLKLKSCKWDLFCFSQNKRLREFCLRKIQKDCQNQIVWMVGLKKNSRTTLFWKETLETFQLNNVILFIVSCS